MPLEEFLPQYALIEGLSPQARLYISRAQEIQHLADTDTRKRVLNCHSVALGILGILPVDQAHMYSEQLTNWGMGVVKSVSEDFLLIDRHTKAIKVDPLSNTDFSDTDYAAIGRTIEYFTSMRLTTIKPDDRSLFNRQDYLFFLHSFVPLNEVLSIHCPCAGGRIEVLPTTDILCDYAKLFGNPDHIKVSKRRVINNF